MHPRQTVAGIAALAPLLAGSAAAQVPAPSGEPTHEQQFQDALLAESASGDHATAARAYEQILRTTALGDPVRKAALYRLAVLQYELGNLGKARKVLQEGIRTGECTNAVCYTLLDQINLEEISVSELPVRWTFSNNDHALLHPWEYDDKGIIRVQARDEAANPALIWATEVDVRKDDRLVVGFDNPSPPPRRIDFYTKADNRPGALRVRVLDDLGRAYEPPGGPFRITPDRPTHVVVDLARVTPLDPEDPPFVPSTIAKLILIDASAASGSPPGSHVLYLDNFVIE